MGGECSLPRPTIPSISVPERTRSIEGEARRVPFRSDRIRKRRKVKERKRGGSRSPFREILSHPLGSFRWDPSAGGVRRRNEKWFRSFLFTRKRCERRKRNVNASREDSSRCFRSCPALPVPLSEDDVSALEPFPNRRDAGGTSVFACETCIRKTRDASSSFHLRDEPTYSSPIFSRSRRARIGIDLSRTARDGRFDSGRLSRVGSSRLARGTFAPRRSRKRKK